MRMMVLGLAVLAAACSNKSEKAAAADAHAASFVPPSVTSRSDYGGMQERRFRRLDKNQDDVLTGDEMPRNNSRLMALDRNGDGEITSSEFSEGQIARFDAMDLNKDGSLTSDERVEARGQR
jgi:hypothetical protein